MLTMREILLYFSIKYKGNWEQIKNALARKEIVSEDEGKALISNIKCNAITFIDSDYPNCIKQAYRPPFVLFYQGNIQLLESRKKLGVVGSRNNSNYGRETTEKIITGLAEKSCDITVVSGMAKGIDSIAERTAIKHNMKIISILGCGVDICYPESSRDIFEYSKTQNGLLISEFPPGIKPLSQNFPMRNRIISSIIHTLLIVEAKRRSGTSITARLSLEDNKDILCVPRNVDSPYKLTNFLIKEGADSCLGAEDVIQAMNRF